MKYYKTKTTEKHKTYLLVCTYYKNIGESINPKKSKPFFLYHGLRSPFNNNINNSGT